MERSRPRKRGESSYADMSDRCEKVCVGESSTGGLQGMGFIGGVSQSRHVELASTDRPLHLPRMA